MVLGAQLMKVEDGFAPDAAPPSSGEPLVHEPEPESDEV
jgi:hypothetical protein